MDDYASPPPLIMKEGSSSYTTTTTTSSKQSSWTSYLVDFETKAHETLCSSSCVSSDATTEGGKGNTVADDVSGQNLTKMRMFKKHNLTDLSLKKRMITGKSADEDELEDTASSPVNCSPKVLHLKNMEVGSADKYNSGDLNTKAYGFSSECSPLGKKGLCLVPVSILHIYKDK